MKNKDKSRNENRNNYDFVINEVLEQEKPFKLTQIIKKLEKKGVTDEGLMLHALDELYVDGFLKYKEVEKEDGKKTWAFVV